MIRSSRMLLIVACLISLLAARSDARGWRLFRHRASTRCQQSTSCCAPSPCRTGFPCTCVLFQLYALGGGQYLYYAEYNESNCSNPQAVYVYGNFSNVNQVCDQCIHGVRQSLTRGDTIPHYVQQPTGAFPGFPTPLPHDHPLHLSSDAKPGGEDWVRYTIDGKTYLAHLMLIGYKNPKSGYFKGVHVAFEVKDFPPNVPTDPTPITPDKVMKCQGQHAYSITYGGSNVLFLTDQAD